jgi:REP element-mobilizing transposase RayT
MGSLILVQPDFPPNQEPTNAQFRVTFYRRNVPRLQRDAKPHFITFVSKDRLVLPDWARDIVLDCCRHDDGTRYQLHVAVVMPDNAHVILTPNVDLRRRCVVPLSEITKAIKGSAAHAINHRLGRTGTVWQEESFDHVLRSSEYLDQKILYVLNNPVRRGLVADWSEYRWLWCKEFVNTYAPTQSAITWEQAQLT